MVFIGSSKNKSGENFFVKKEMESLLFEWVRQPIFTDALKLKVTYVNNLILFKLNKYQRRRTKIHLGFFSNEEHSQLFSMAYCGKQRKYKKYFERDNEDQFLTIITTSFSRNSPCPFIRQKQTQIEKEFSNRGIICQQTIDFFISNLFFTYKLDTMTLELIFTTEKKITSNFVIENVLK